MVPKAICYTAALGGLWTVCSPQHLTPTILKSSSQVMITRPVFMKLLGTVAFISVVHDLNASNTSIPCFLRITLGLLLYVSASQSFKTSLLIQTLGSHLTMICLKSCTLGIVLWSKIMYGGGDAQFGKFQCFIFYYLTCNEELRESNIFKCQFLGKENLIFY